MLVSSAQKITGAKILVASLVLVGIGLAIAFAPKAKPLAADSLTIAPGNEFTADSYVHQRLRDDAPIDERSDIWVKDLQDQIKTHYGKPTVNFDQYSPPIYIVPENQPTVRVLAQRAFDKAWSFPPLQALWNDVPLPENLAPARGTDRDAIIYQPSTGRYWEFWILEKTGRKVKNSAGQTVPEWQAAWGGQIRDLKSNPGYFPTTPEGYKFGTAATGLALLGGLMTIEEQQKGRIEHALHFAIPKSRSSVWTHPAQRTDGNNPDENAIPQGVTFRLPADLDLDALDMDPYARMVAKAVQKYGMVLRDTAGSVTFYAEKPKEEGSAHPYYGKNGILRCPDSVFSWSCSASSRLEGFPWDKLQALKTAVRSDPE
jgi:hypothetical protein